MKQPYKIHYLFYTLRVLSGWLLSPVYHSSNWLESKANPTQVKASPNRLMDSAKI